GQVDVFLVAVPNDLNPPCDLFLLLNVELHVNNLGAVMELDVKGLQIFYHRQDHGLILIVLCKAERLEIRQAAHMMDEPLNIKLHLQRAVPILKSKHSAPVQPEI